MVVVSILIAWAVLSLTYLYFRKALKDRQIDGVKKAQSPFQPFLAVWAFAWSTFTGLISFIRADSVLFQCFKAFLGPKSSYWSIANESWALQLASISGVVVFIILIGISRLVIGKAAYRHGELTVARILAGAAEIEPLRDRNMNGFVALLDEL